MQIYNTKKPLSRGGGKLFYFFLLSLSSAFNISSFHGYPPDERMKCESNAKLPHRHPENFYFRALHSAVVVHENSWGSSYYQGVMDPFNRPIDKAIWGKPRFWVSGRLPQIFMVANHFPPCPKMKIFAMTRVVSNISGCPIC